MLEDCRCLVRIIQTDISALFPSAVPLCTYQLIHFMNFKTLLIKINSFTPDGLIYKTKICDSNILYDKLHMVGVKKINNVSY